ncbi:hypothetical protein HNR42_002788 [Deinobacterium chartae]|uniref:Uncharacterized protein n=1 Tax=Deinobacterium chartae TaxID=521158 RepID=A0A841I0Z6_9DEIO|nr:hypothetical protein [Deinobacterium chartae]MBB6099347.1 hypothetical protein [Deinobacterium chartae]
MPDYTCPACIEVQPLVLHITQQPTGELYRVFQTCQGLHYDESGEVLEAEAGAVVRTGRSGRCRHLDAVVVK